MKLSSTGERAVRDVTPERIWSDHVARYRFCAPFVFRRRILDAACGSGFGSDILARSGAKLVVGVDVSGEAIQACAAEYAKSGTKFVQASVTDLPIATGAVDAVVSFETIEHVPRFEPVLAEFARVLPPGGILLISTPNRRLTSPLKPRTSPPDNAFHFVEFVRSEFEEALATHFDVMQTYGQRLNLALLFRPGVFQLARRLAPRLLSPERGDSAVVSIPPGFEPRYMVFVCQRR